MGVKRSAPETTTGFADKEKNKLFGNKVWLKGYIGLGGEEPWYGNGTNEKRKAQEVEQNRHHLTQSRCEGSRCPILSLY